MSVVLLGSTSGSVTLQEPAVAGSTVIDLPATSGTMAVLPTATSVLPEASGGTGTTTGYYGFKSRIINGAMVIDQRNAGASVTPTNAAAAFATDRFAVSVSQNSKCTIQQNAGSVTPPAGYSKYLGFTVGAAAGVTVGAGDYFLIQQRIEGNNLADMGFGAASASTFTVSFWVRSSVTGTFGFALQNGGQTRSYATTYTINAANTWEQKTITVAGDTSGTWATDNTGGLYCSWGLGVGSTYAIAAGSSWSTTTSPNGFGVTGTTQLIQTNSATFYITGVQLEKGSTATSFDYRPIGTELALCQRYFQKIVMENATQSIGSAGSGGSQIYSQRYFLPVTMRTSPSITYPTVGQATGNITYLQGGSYPSPAGGTISSQEVEADSFNFAIQHTASAWGSMDCALLFATGASDFKLSAEL